MNNKQHGEAKFTNKKGQSKNGMWENGERVKWLDWERAQPLLA